MQSPRSSNVEDKPKAKNWLESNQKKSQLFLEVLNRLNMSYVGGYDGFVDFEPPQYRYNGTELGEYTVVSARGDGCVKIELLLENDIWELFVISTLDDLDSVIYFMEKNQFKSFCFSLEQYASQFESQVQQSLNRDSFERKKRLAVASKKSAKFQSKVTVYKRNPDVVAEVLIRAKGKCECCGAQAPFDKRKDGEPYLEVHHKVFLSKGGDDTVDNAEALCPNCHREKHFGKQAFKGDLKRVAFVV